MNNEIKTDFGVGELNDEELVEVYFDEEPKTYKQALKSEQKV